MPRIFPKKSPAFRFERGIIKTEGSLKKKKIQRKEKILGDSSKMHKMQ
jgi:hypothetical protein